MSYDNPEIEDIPGLVFTAAETGGVRITSHLSWEDVQQVVPNLREAAGSDAEIEARLVAWAGPYEIYLTIKPFLEDLGLVVGTAYLARDAIKKIPEILNRFVRKNPDKEITVIYKGRKIRLNGKPLSEKDALDVAQFFAENQDPPTDKLGPYNQPI